MGFVTESLSGVFKPSNKPNKSMGFISERLIGVFNPSNRLNWRLSGFVDLEIKTDDLGTI